MKYAVCKMFKKCQVTGDLSGAKVTISRDDGQSRMLHGKVGTPNSDGYYVAELRGNGRLIIECDADTVFYIVPLGE